MKQHNVDESTYASYRFSVEKGIIPYFEEKHPGLLLTELTAKHIQDYYTYELRERNVSTSTVTHHCASIVNAKNYAVPIDPIFASNTSSTNALLQIFPETNRGLHLEFWCILLHRRLF